VKPRSRPGRIAGAADPNDPREAPIAALHQMERRVAARAPCGFFAGDEQAVAFREQANRVRIDAWEVDDDFDGLVGFVDIDGGRALAGERFGAEDAPEFKEDPADLFREVPKLRRNGDRMKPGAHKPE